MRIPAGRRGVTGSSFISGRPPGGDIPHTSGTLKVVDVVTGAERDLPTPDPTAGTPAWSPDGESVVCGLQAQNRGSLLYEIPVAGGPARQLQHRPHGVDVGPWIETAFVARRGGPPQLWSMPAGDRRVMVQMQLSSPGRDRSAWKKT